MSAMKVLGKARIANLENAAQKLPITNKSLPYNAAQLQNIAQACGLAKSGPKLQVSQRIQYGLRTYHPVTPDMRLLSIDLGIKNFAYSLLVPADLEKIDDAKAGEPESESKPFDLSPESWLAGDGVAGDTAAFFNALAGDEGAVGSDEDAVGGDKATYFNTVKVGDWFSETDKYAKRPKFEEQRRKEMGNGTRRLLPPSRLRPYELHAWSHLSLRQWMDDNRDGRMANVHSEEFSPAAVAAVALRLIEERFLPLKPTHILIERQRFRNSGSATVFEWTVRVNMLEAMLYAALEALRRSGRWDGVVVPVPPKRVSTYIAEGFERLEIQEDPIKLKMARYKWEVDEAYVHSIHTFKDRDMPDSEDPEAELPAEAEADDEMLAGLKQVDVKESTEVDGKKKRIMAVRNWIHNNQTVRLMNGEVAAIAELFDKLAAKAAKHSEHKLLTVTQRRVLLGAGASGKISERKQAIADVTLKVDDLSDSLAQGIVWMEWQKNIEYLIKTKQWARPLIENGRVEEEPEKDAKEQAEEVEESEEEGGVERQSASQLAQKLKTSGKTTVALPLTRKGRWQAKRVEMELKKVEKARAKKQKELEQLKPTDPLGELEILARAFNKPPKERRGPKTTEERQRDTMADLKRRRKEKIESAMRAKLQMKAVAEKQKEAAAEKQREAKAENKAKAEKQREAKAEKQKAKAEKQKEAKAEKLKKLEKLKSDDPLVELEIMAAAMNKPSRNRRNQKASF